MNLLRRRVNGLLLLLLLLMVVVVLMHPLLLCRMHSIITIIITSIYLSCWTSLKKNFVSWSSISYLWDSTLISRQCD
ncbi:unnamed protein product [Schistosoma curassoni]|uniref:Secreted protein n=1 Tax=Schistosoma curassoni TaxID=6186 RepID=A0A183JF03_9TREM|nr:unnamed protein product [Schistosoma curassoni]